MQKQITLLFFLCIYTFSFSQNTDENSGSLNGQVVSAEEKKALSAAHILNLNSVSGTITDSDGYFSVVAKTNDTILISYIGFESIKLKVTNDLLKGNELVIALNEKPEEVKEVIIKNTNLIGVLEVDIKQVPVDKYNRIHLNGLPQTYEVGRPQPKDFSSPLAALFNPVDFLYNRLGKKPKELKKLKKLKTEDNLRKMLAGKFDREVMMEYLGIDKQELAKLLNDCNYSEYFAKKASDLQMIEAILDCYENYKAHKKGKIQINKIPEKTSDGE